jgi:hypothetical protein
MALVADGFAMTVTLQDTQGDTVTKRYALRGADAAAAAADGVAIRTALAAVSESQIIGYSVGEVFIENAPAFPADADNSIKARVSWRKTNARAASFDIPSPVEGIFVGTTGQANNTVDMTDAALLAYAALFYSTGNAFISDDEDLAVGGGLDGQRVSVVKRKRRF